MSNLQTVLLECEYFPCIAWYQQFLLNEGVLLEKYEFFERASLRNRCYIAGPNGKLALTVPLQGGRNQKTIMKDLKICNQEPWQILHWKTLLACYNRSPYFEYFKDSMSSIFERKYGYLLDLNIDSLETINKLLSINKKLSFTAYYQKVCEVNTIDLRLSYKSTNSQHKGSINYIQSFEEKNGFIPGLSMLDLLFCKGKYSVDLLLGH